MPLTPGLVSFFDCFGFSRVFAFFGGPIEMRAFLVVNMRLGVNPNQAMTPRWARALLLLPECSCLLMGLVP
jgi:hypothetical protein